MESNETSSLRQPSTPRLNRPTFQTSRLLEFCSEKKLTAQTGHESGAPFSRKLADGSDRARPIVQSTCASSPASHSMRRNGSGLVLRSLATNRRTLWDSWRSEERRVGKE